MKEIFLNISEVNSHLLGDNERITWFGRGNDLSNLKKYSEAIKCYDKALEIDPEYVDALNNKGDALYELGEYNEAIKCYDKTIEIDPKNADALTMKGMALDYLGNYNAAIECADRAMAIKENYSEALALKGEALGYQGKYVEAIDCAVRAINIDNSDYAWFVKGYAIDYSGKHDEALECFRKAIKINPNNADALHGMGVALNYKNCYNEAERYFNDAIQIRVKKMHRYQDIAYSYLNKSVSLYNLKRDKEEVIDCLNVAKSYSDEALSRNQNDVHAWMIKGVSCFKLGLYDMAMLCFNKIIIDLNREFHHAWSLKGYVLNYLERYEEALNYFCEAIKMNPEDPDYYIGKGISLYALEEYDEAIKCFDIAGHKEKAYLDLIFFLKGASNYGKQWYIEALDDFKEVGCDVNFEGQRHISIGSCYYRIGLVDKARNEYYAAIESNPKLAESYYNLGVISNNDGKTEIARKQFESCLIADRKFTKASEALEKLESPSSTSEWFKWWFSSGKGKKAFGIGLILFIFALIIFAVAGSTYVFYANQKITLLHLSNQNITSQFLSLNQSILSSTITGIILMTGFLIVILLLPSIRRFKVFDIEMEPIPVDTKVQQHMEAIISKVKFGMQSF